MHLKAVVEKGGSRQEVDGDHTLHSIAITVTRTLRLPLAPGPGNATETFEARARTSEPYIMMAGRLGNASAGLDRWI
jgi:hypothetical protein